MRKVLIIILLTLYYMGMTLPVSGRENIDSAFQKLYNDYNKAYAAANDDTRFHELSQNMKEYYKQKKDENGYYITLLNEVLYDSEHGNAYNAIKKANAMMNEIKEKGINQYDKVNMALGSVYEGRGNYRMSDYFYHEALKTVAPDNKRMLNAIYSRMATLKLSVDPEESRQWNEKCRQLNYDNINYQQLYHFIDAATQFFLGNYEAFNKAFNEYMAFKEENKNKVDDYGLFTINTMKLAVDGNYDEALGNIPRTVSCGDLSLITSFDLKAKIYQMQGKVEEVLEATMQRRDARDSLNSDMLFSNLNEINAELNSYLEKRANAKKMGWLAIIIIILAFITIAMLVVWIFRHKKMRQRLMEKNEELKAALSMAEESDRMKTEFVRQVSHEIRTPLNAINGFNEILNDPNMVLPEEERKDLVNRIRENTKDITDIVDKMLFLSERESNENFVKKDHMLCNKVLSELLYRNRLQVSPAIELNYTTEVINRFTILTNEASVVKIVDQLLRNAIKFTTRGSITIDCRTINNGTKLEISVTDTGRGIKPELRSQIFDKFVKEDHFLQGIGLGLTVSRKIAKRLGGDLTLDNTYNQGARFILTLPVE